MTWDGVTYPPPKCPECGGFQGDPPERLCGVCQTNGCTVGDNTWPCQEEAEGTCGCGTCWDSYFCWCGILCPTCGGYLIEPPKYLCRLCATGYCLTRPEGEYPCNESGRAACGCPHCWTLCSCGGSEVQR